jgi:hypothetical protein
MYSKWLDLVSVPVTFVTPHIVERPDLHFDPPTYTTRTTWAGLAVNKPNMRYSGAIATFTVPSFTSTGTGSNASMWVGLDGVGTLEMIQDGIYYPKAAGVGAYQAWYEYWDPYGVRGPPVFPGFNASPGDSVTFWAWEGDSACNFGYPNNVGYGCFYWMDNTTGQVIPGGQPVAVAEPWGGFFTGATCEGIMERQAPGGVPTILARWSAASMEFDCYDYFGGLHNAGGTPAPFGEPYLDFKMVNSSGNILATAFKTYGTPDFVTFNWVQAQ